MAYRTIMTVLTSKEAVDGLLDQAIALASKHDAHLDVLCLGVDRAQIGYYYGGADATILQDAVDRAVAESKDIQAAADKRLTGESIRWSSESDLAQLGDIGRRIGWQARFADVVLLPKPYGENKGVELEPVMEAALFDGRAPVIMLPEGAPAPVAPKKVLLAWNETPEALAAIRKAMPILKSAEEVHIVVIDPPAHGLDRSDPGGMLAGWLSRHGVSAEIEVIAKTLPRISDLIMRHATELGADMVVMGAYGHSRFRQAILGGATRNMMEGTTLPVFLAH
ncbi:universal stress protein [Pseudooceanicola sp. HF7]|uniref:universal stress protein n=1 Tax=Pseudooceanicola sp. HF7 TaxID=2721560 RepID=UPI001431AC31|nr:universal stress protein [Pseudooceanicola sp. HF7]NIZ11594.1 universal stress protein [Pseudooceanicola sp. HF7]